MVKTYSNMTLREYFAGEAFKITLVQALGVSEKALCQTIGIEESQYDLDVHWPQYVAKLSVQLADALMKELEQP